jgi:hypothetical protein
VLAVEEWQCRAGWFRTLLACKSVCQLHVTKTMSSCSGPKPRLHRTKVIVCSVLF